MGLRDRLRAAKLRRDEVVEFEGEKVTIREMSLGQRVDFANKARAVAEGDQSALLDISLGAVVLCVYDPESGEPAFSDEDVAWLREQGQSIQALSDHVLRVSGLTGDSASAAVARAEGNS